MPSSSAPKQKQAITNYPVLSVIENRWSPRSFDNTRPVEVEKLCSALEAARWAPSSYNEQPWRFIIGNKFDNNACHEKLQSILVEGNNWAKQVPVLILAIAKNHFTQTGSLNRHHFHDVGLAMGQLCLQATSEGLHSHMMAGLHSDKAYELFDIPRGDYTPCVMVAIGYLGAPQQLTEDWQLNAEKAERYRKPLQDLIFSDTWGQPYSRSFT